MTLTIITICLGMLVFIDLFEYALKETWGVVRVVSFLIALPFIIVLLVLAELQFIAITFIIGAWIFGRFTIFKKPDAPAKGALKSTME